MDAQWWLGNLPDWLAGAGAVLAVLVASLALHASHQANLYQNDQIQQQAKQLDEIRVEKRRGQADRVSAWLESGPEYKTFYRVSNRSGQPIHNFCVWWIDNIERARPVVSWLVPPGEWRLPEHLEQCAPASPLALAEDMQMPITYFFSDLGQRNWKREFDGTLVQMDSLTYSPYAVPVPLQRVPAGIEDVVQ